LGKGNTTPKAKQLQAMEGKDILCKGAMSTAAAQTGLRISADQVEYKIHIPAGAKGAGMWIGNTAVNPSFGVDQREFVMNRDSMYKVGKSKFNRSRNIYEVDVFWIGLSQHDYGKAGKPVSYQ